jgi:hypothetical protein
MDRMPEVRSPYANPAVARARWATRRASWLVPLLTLSVSFAASGCMSHEEVLSTEQDEEVEQPVPVTADENGDSGSVEGPGDTALNGEDDTGFDTEAGWEEEDEPLTIEAMAIRPCPAGTTAGAWIPVPLAKNAIGSISWKPRVGANELQYINNSAVPSIGDLSIYIAPSAGVCAGSLTTDTITYNYKYKSLTTTAANQWINIFPRASTAAGTFYYRQCSKN